MPQPTSLETDSLDYLREAVGELEKMFGDLPPFAGTPPAAEWRAVLMETAQRLCDNYPYPHPLYAGQMLKPPHPIARLAYSLAMWINPNNHAAEGGRASIIMEQEAVADIARMFGWQQVGLAHLCSSGTVANLEALWIARQYHPDKKIVGSQEAHYTHRRACRLLQSEWLELPCDQDGRLDLNALQEALSTGTVGTVVVSLGTTARGACDPLSDIYELQQRYPFRIHIDAAYGGYFILAGNLAPAVQNHYAHSRYADSIVIDPHKHGLQAYGCSCLLLADPQAKNFYTHDSPYSYFDTDGEAMHVGKTTLECSRSGAAAVALWATQRLLPLCKGGSLATDLEKSHAAAVQLHHRLSQQQKYLSFAEPELDILVWAAQGKTAAAVSQASRASRLRLMQQGLYLAELEVPAWLFQKHHPQVVIDQDYVTCLRSCLMKPEHHAWLDEIYQLIIAD